MTSDSKRRYKASQVELFGTWIQHIKQQLVQQILKPDTPIALMWGRTSYKIDICLLPAFLIYKSHVQNPSVTILGK